MSNIEVLAISSIEMAFDPFYKGSHAGDNPKQLS
jgi:hypothetical protein